MRFASVYRSFEDVERVHARAEGPDPVRPERSGAEEGRARQAQGAACDDAGARRCSVADSIFCTRRSRLRSRLGRTAPIPPRSAPSSCATRPLVGRGYHRRAGGPHVEVFALAEPGARARGATLYVTLEPCCHFGRTPPCVDAVLASGVRASSSARVDPNPRVRGRGVARLTRAGPGRRRRARAASAASSTRTSRSSSRRGLPFVMLKLAATLDGRIAAAKGDRAG